jgi:hypothetical protein
MNYKVVFHLDQDDEGSALVMGLTNITNMLAAVSGEDAEIHMVANGDAIKLFKLDLAQNQVETIKTLHKQGVRFCLCNNSMKKFGFKKEQMLEQCEIVPAGIVELCRLQHEGCAYIKP